MKNKYFQSMRKKGLEYKKTTGRTDLFTVSQSAAFSFWAISDRINASEVIIDYVPDNIDVDEFLFTFKEAGINQILLTGIAVRYIDIFQLSGCSIIGSKKVQYRETQLFSGKCRYADGILIHID